MSHFSFTRSAYDECALNQKNKESAGPGLWATDSSITESKSACFEGTSPFMHNPYRSIPKTSIDVENDLRGQTRLLSKCAEHKYNPNNQKTFINELTNCDNGLVPEYTRLNKPCNIFAGININRFHPLCEDLQELNKIHDNTYIGSNTRLKIQDAFKQAKQ